MNLLNKFFSKKTTSVSTGDTVSAESSQETNQESTFSIASEPSSILKQNLSVDELKKFAPLRDLDAASLAVIPHASLGYQKGDIIFALGQYCENVYYLLKGSIYMQPNGGARYEIVADSALSRLPLNSSQICGATAVAAKEVIVLEISVELNRLWADKSKEHASCTELVDIQIPTDDKYNGFYSSFARAYRENKLLLPSLPNVALRLKEAMQHDIGVKEAVDIIHIDPPIVAKLIQIANSPLYSSGTPISNCQDAVSRIGLDATRNLVMGISMKQLFNCQDADLMNGMKILWKNSLFVSSLCFVLAQDSKTINPEDALLAGIVADIGAIPLLHFAEQFSGDRPSFEELQASLTFLRAPVGGLVLHTLGFSEQLTNIPHLAENWLYDSGPKLTLADLVILAKLHSYFGTGKARDLPYINSIPAYSKLDNGKLNPDFSLNLLEQAKQRINTAMQLLS